MPCAAISLSVSRALICSVILLSSQPQNRHSLTCINAAKKEKPDAVLIAGDIYDKAAPSGDAFDLFNDFLVEFSQIDPQIPVLIISGNHDSNLRLNYASSFIEKDKIYIAATLPTEQSEHLKKIEIEDEDGKVNFYLLPFTKPADAKNLLGEECNIRTYDDAVAGN